MQRPGSRVAPETSLGSLAELGAATRKCRAALLAARPDGRSAEREWFEYLKSSRVVPVQWLDFAEQWAQALVCARATWQSLESAGRVPPRELLNACSSPLVSDLFVAQALDDESLEVPAGADPCRFFETYVSRHDPVRRSRFGIYYTPSALARFLVRRLHYYLKREFKLDDGIASCLSWKDLVLRKTLRTAPGDPQRPFLQIIDPAMGDGVFLVEIVQCVFEQLQRRWRSENRSRKQRSKLWNRYVKLDLLPRLFGVELLPAALAVAHLQLGASLWKTGFEFREPTPFELVLGNSLDGPQQPPALTEAKQRFEFERLQRIAWQETISVVVGNPPFSAISSNSGRWIRNLLRGREERKANAGSYFEVEGQPIAERKHWLQDDYVKFFRYAQWQIDRAGAGVVAYVSNHGYLDNPTFRGMRAELLRAFPRIDVVDLHGNRKKHERSPDGQGDENVFAIESGIALALLRRPLASVVPRVRHTELWGNRESKLSAVSRGPAPPAVAIRPRAPFFLLTRQQPDECPIYSAGVPLNQAFRKHSTAAVTARDHLVIDFDREQLIDRLRQFGDLSISDQSIRERFFNRSRSSKYPPGDTRGWKLDAARRKMAVEENWEQCIRTCLYRPFDRRWIFWADWMIDWPRSEITRHLLGRGNLALIARRQMLPHHPCTFFWISDTVTLDGVIRSDNRGSESVFPLYVVDGGAHSSNFDAALAATICELLQLRWVDAGPGDGRRTVGPEDLFYYIYALFHSPTYRRRYQRQLRLSFPHILLPASRALFRSLVEVGRRVAQLHLASESPTAQPSMSQRLGVNYPQYVDQKVVLSPQCHLAGVDRDTWQFRIGGHQVCRKWLRDRRNRPLGTLLEPYRQLVAAIQNTQIEMRAIDQIIETAGGWRRAFLAGGHTGKKGKTGTICAAGGFAKGG